MIASRLVWRTTTGVVRMRRHAAIVVALGCIACGKSTPEEIETETVVPVKVEAARLGSVRATIHATGVVEPAPGADQVVTAPEAARIAEMPKAEGDRVRRGDLLVRFDIPSLRADTEARRAAVAKAEAMVRNAKAAQARARDLFDRGVAARKEVEDADRDVAEAEAALAEARAGSAASATLAERATVVARFNGIVSKRTHNPGDLVEPSAADPILRVIDPARLQVDASIPISDVSRIMVGANARMLLSPESPPVPLKVVSRPAEVEAGTAAVPVRLAFLSPPSQLAAGMPVQVDIDAEEHRDVVVVPATALVREGNEVAVFVAADGKAHRRVVSAGLSDGEHVEVVSGLNAGEIVITHGQSGLPDGAAINVSK